MSVTRRVLFFALVTVLTVGTAATAEAQRWRGPGRSVVVVRGGYGYYDPFWYGYGYGYPWYGFGYGYPWYPYQYPIGPYPYYNVDRGSAVRLEVSPKEAEVYVDGYYAGIVDDYDGTFQRLHLPPGEHEITLYREGYRTVHQNVYLTPESTFKVRYTMERLAAGDTAEPRPTPSAQPSSTQTQTQTEPGQGPPPSTRRAPGGRRLPPPNQRGGRTGDASSSGALSIRVQPDNATVLIDGERWEGPQGQERLIVQVSDGPHQIQIQREGYESFTANVTVRQGETVPLNVSLRTR